MECFQLNANKDPMQGQQWVHSWWPHARHVFHLSKGISSRTRLLLPLRCLTEVCVSTNYNAYDCLLSKAMLVVSSPLLSTSADDG